MSCRDSYYDKLVRASFIQRYKLFASGFRFFFSSGKLNFNFFFDLHWRFVFWTQISFDMLSFNIGISLTVLTSNNGFGNKKNQSKFQWLIENIKFLHWNFVGWVFKTQATLTFPGGLKLSYGLPSYTHCILGNLDRVNNWLQ